MLNDVRLIALTAPKVPECLTAEDLVAYCARVSNPTNQGNRGTAPKLLRYLLDHRHWSPFEMVHVVMEITTTRDISRQILRHRSFSFQEFSTRYSAAHGFSLRACRMQDTKNRQNSLLSKNRWIDAAFWASQRVTIGLCNMLYRLMLRLGVAKEQARAILPEGLIQTRLYMAGSLRSWVHYCQLRTGNGTQKEHADIATACWAIIAQEFPSLPCTHTEKGQTKWEN